MMKLKFTLAASAALALAACGSSEDTPVPEATEPTGALAEADAAATASEAPLPTDAQGFVAAASASDLYEVQAGKLAQANGTSQAVKDFGKMMEDDHTKSSADLKAAAAKASVTVNPQLTEKQLADLEALRNAGADFDSVYKTQQLAAHQQALSLLQGYASSGDQDALKDFAGKTAPVVQKHLEHVQTLP